MIPKTPHNLDALIKQLRDVSLGMKEGERLGNEDDLTERFGASRGTIRQAARLVERDGLLSVRRGVNGGYYAARPSLDLIVSVVCTYLDTLGYDDRHVGTIATSLWLDAVRDAAVADPAKVAAFVDRFSPRIAAITSESVLEDIATLEQESWFGIFELIGGDYFKLLFRINAAFAARHRSSSLARLSPGEISALVMRWKAAKSAELVALSAGDVGLAIIAALNTRRLWGDDDPATRRAILI